VLTAGCGEEIDLEFDFAGPTVAAVSKTGSAAGKRFVSMEVSCAGRRGHTVLEFRKRRYTFEKWLCFRKGEDREARFPILNLPGGLGAPESHSSDNGYEWPFNASQE